MNRYHDMTNSCQGCARGFSCDDYSGLETHPRSCWRPERRAELGCDGCPEENDCDDCPTLWEAQAEALAAAEADPLADTLAEFIRSAEAAEDMASDAETDPAMLSTALGMMVSDYAGRFRALASETPWHPATSAAGVRFFRRD